MPNGHEERKQDELELIAAIESDGWDYYDDPPGWVLKAAKNDDVDKGAGFEPRRKTYNGETYVYLAVSSVHNRHVHVFSREKNNDAANNNILAKLSNLISE